MAHSRAIESFASVNSAVANAPSLPMVETADLSRLTEIFRRDAHWVLRLLRRFGLDPTEAEDVTQEVFLVLRRRLGEIRPGEERGFLFHTARFLGANAQRVARRRLDEIAPDEPIDDIPAALPDAERQFVERHELNLLQEVLDAMPSDLRDVFILFEIEEMTFTEISEIAGIPVGTAKSRLLRARRVFQREARRHGLGEGPRASATMSREDPS